MTLLGFRKKSSRKWLSICQFVLLMFCFLTKKGIRYFFLKEKNRPIRGEYFSAGGRLLKNEEFCSGAIRKIQEELGIVLVAEKMVFGGVINEIYEDSEFGEVNYHAVNICWGYVLRGDEEIVFDGQHDESRWFGVDDLSLHKYLKERIKLLGEKI